MNLHPQLIIDTSYFAAAFLFIYGLKRMSSPVTLSVNLSARVVFDA